MPTSLGTSQGTSEGSEVTLRPPGASLFPLCPMASWLPSAHLLHLHACLPASWWRAQRWRGGPATQGAAEVNPLSETALVCWLARGSSLQMRVQGGPGESPSHSRVDFDQGEQWGSVTLRASGQPGQGTQRSGGRWAPGIRAKRAPGRWPGTGRAAVLTGTRLWLGRLSTEQGKCPALWVSGNAVETQWHHHRRQPLGASIQAGEEQGAITGTVSRDPAWLGSAGGPPAVGRGAGDRTKVAVCPHRNVHGTICALFV